MVRQWTRVDLLLSARGEGAGRSRPCAAAALALLVSGAGGRVLAQTQAQAQDRPPASSLSLVEALDYARAHYPSVRAALAQKTAAERDVDAARAAYLPQVNLLWQINRATMNNITGVLLPQSVIPSVSGPVLPSSGQSAWNSGAGALVSWRPYDFGFRAARVDAARQASAAADQTVALTELDVLTATGDAYMNLAAAQSLAKVAEANAQRLHAFASAAHVLVDNKLRPGVDGQQADAAEGLARTALISARGQVDNQRATLAELVGRPQEALAIDAASLDRPPPEPAGDAAGAADDHPAARQEAARVRQQAAELQAAGKAFAPQIDVVGGAFTRGSGRTAAGVYTGGNTGLEPNVGNWSVGVQMTVPLGSFPVLNAQRASQKARLDAERDRYDQTVDQLNTRLIQARTNLRSARAIAKVTPVSLEAARQTETQQRARFQSGLATVVDVTAAEASLAEAESQDAIARLNVWRALAALAAAQGDFSQFRTLAAR
jgi:outer membrane protein TolC